MMIVRLPKTGTIILTGDNVYFRENVEKHIPPNLVLAYDPAGIMKAYDWIRYMMATEGADFFTAHDPDAFKAMKKAPGLTTNERGARSFQSSHQTMVAGAAIRPGTFVGPSQASSPLQSMAPIIVADHLTKRYGRRLAVDDVSFASRARRGAGSAGAQRLRQNALSCAC